MIGLLNNNLQVQFLDNSRKRQTFPGFALKQYCPNTYHEKPMGLCKTHWDERHCYLKTFDEIYEYEATCFDAMVNPYFNESLE